MNPCFVKPLAADQRGRGWPMSPCSDPAAWDFGLDFDSVGIGIGIGFARSQATADSLVTVVDGRLQRSLQYDCQIGTDVLLIRASVSNDCTYATGGGAPWQFRSPAVTVSMLPEGTRLSIAIEPGVAQRTVTMLIRPVALLDHHGIEPNALPEPLRRAIESPVTKPVLLVTLPTDPDVMTLVNDLVHSRLHGTLRRMQVRARSHELLALMASHWNERLAADRWPGARGRDEVIVAFARRILCERFADPPTLQELATLVGTNKNKLNLLFHKRLGMTPQVFCLQRRIERAQALIAEGRLSVGQVSEAVGYQHQSSFSEAFVRVVGLSPREFARRHRAPLERALGAVH